MTSLLLLAATRWEAVPLASRLGLTRAGTHHWSGRVAGRAVTLRQTAMGAERTAAALAGAAPGLLISTGFAGALQSGLRTGELIAEELFPCPEAAAALRRSGFPMHFGRLAHSDRVLADPEDKLSLGRSTGALAVDMESSAVRAWAQARGTPALALRVILDEAAFAFPRDLPQSEDSLTLARYAAGHPADWPRLAGLWLRQRQASKALAFILQCLLETL